MRGADWARVGLAAALIAAPARAAPDFSGLWSNNSLTNLERPEDFKTLVVSEAEAKTYEAKHRGKPPENPQDTVGGQESEWWETDVGLLRVRGQIRSSQLVSTADGQLPFNGATKAANKARSARRKVDFDAPESRSRDERCLSTDAAGPPLLNGGYNDNYQFVQTSGELAILAEYMHDVRIVRLAPDARHPPLTIRRAMGDSIGHWEGETLVIETTNFTRAEVGSLAKPGDDMTVVERITRLSPTALHYAFWVRNPVQFTQPWQGEMIFNATKGPIYEFACHEGNYALPGILAGGRQAEARARAAFAAMAAAKATVGK
jgi:hypothetical protein